MFATVGPRFKANRAIALVVSITFCARIFNCALRSKTGLLLWNIFFSFQGWITSDLKVKTNFTSSRIVE